MTNVIKKNGTQEPFNIEKIKNAVKAAGKDASLDEAKQNELAESISSKVEALRLRNIKDLEQEEAAKKMNTSQSTFQRILSSAYKKITEALIEGKAIKIIK